MKRLLRVALVGGFALLTLGTTVALADNICNSGEGCIWDSVNFSGQFWDPSTSDPDWPSSVDNEDDSIRNRETKGLRVFDGNTYTGGVKYCLSVAQYEEDDINGSRDSDGQSHYLWSTAGCPAGDPMP